MKTTFAYSRGLVLSDGLVIDLTFMGREAGFSVPVAVSESVWTRCIELDNYYDSAEAKVERARDILWMLRTAVNQLSTNGDEHPVVEKVDFWIELFREGDDYPDSCQLNGLFGLAENGKPAIVVTFPEEVL